MCTSALEGHAYQHRGLIEWSSGLAVRWTPLTRYRLRCSGGILDVEKDSAVWVSGGGIWISIAASAVWSPEEAAAFQIGGLATDSFI